MTIRMRVILVAIGTAVLCPLAFPAGAQTAPATTDSVVTPTSASSTNEPAVVDTVSLQDIQTFTRVYATIKRAYVDEVDDTALMQAAIRGMLSGFDPHSEYLDLAALRQLREDTSGEYAGIGVRVAAVHGELRVIAPLDGTPAAEAGIRAGDVILSINADPVTAETIDHLLDELRGPAGSEVHLSILHLGATQPEALTLVRERIRVASVRSRMLDPGYAYLRISEFQQQTPADLRSEVQALIERHGPLRGAVLDLRSNPGGLLTAAVGVSDLFLRSGLIVSTKGRLQRADLEFRASGEDILGDAPMVVLIDNGTASAAEIVAGALKDQHRALLMGRRSFGKGSVQTVLPIDDDHAVKLTTARYFTPSGNSIQAAGISPDIRLADLSVHPREAPPTLMLSEADLPNHLQGSPRILATPTELASSLAIDDYALSEALHVLKGMAIARRAAPTAR